MPHPSIACSRGGADILVPLRPPLVSSCDERAILVVEDDDDIRDGIAELLRDEGHALRNGGWGTSQRTLKATLR